MTETQDNEHRLVAFARDELSRAGLFDDDSDYAGKLGNAVLEIVCVFAEQGHSGGSAQGTIALLEKLLRFEPLTPLTGEDDEWVEVREGLFQNNRCSRIFKENGVSYDIERRVFREPSGTCFTSRDSFVTVTFPYTPTTEIFDVDESDA